MSELMNKIIGDEKSVAWMKEDNFKRVIFLTKHGSHAYGTNTPESDEDFRGVCIPPQSYFIGFIHKFEQIVKKEPDAQIFDIRKFFSLAFQNNPNILEVLFTDEADHLHVTPAGRELLDHREEFVSKAAKQRFLGYARQQAHRIKTHRRWLFDPPKAPPTRAECGLPEKPPIKEQDKDVIFSQIRKKVDEWNLDFEPFSDVQKIYLNDKLSDILSEMHLTSDARWAAAARTLGLQESFIKLLIDEKSFDSRQEDWNNFQEWKKKRNPARAALEAKFGYDTKHGGHLVRLLRMGKEIVADGKVIVKRPDFKELLEIRNGLWTYEQLIEYAEKLEVEINLLYQTSKVRAMPDHIKINRLCERLVLASF